MGFLPLTCFIRRIVFFKHGIFSGGVDLILSLLNINRVHQEQTRFLQVCHTILHRCVEYRIAYYHVFPIKRYFNC